MSTNPNSINYRDPNLGYQGRAAARKFANDSATKATGGEAGRLEGDKGKAAVERYKGNG
jgi:hypothetical protein